MSKRASSSVLTALREGNTANRYDAGFYSTEYYTSNLLRYLLDRDGTSDDRPFFAYLPFAAPHWPLQCSPQDRADYTDIYNDGPDALRLKRLQRLKKLGIIGEHVVPHKVMNFGMKEWKDMGVEERAKNAKAMEVYAGMVQCIDRNVGRVLKYLEGTGELDSQLCHIRQLLTLQQIHSFCS